MSENLSLFLSQTFLFRGMSKEQIDNALLHISYDERDFHHGDIIYSPDGFEKKVGFIIHGECDVIKRRDERGDVVINTLMPCDSFGILAVVLEEPFPTEIVAKRNTRVLFINDTDVIRLISNDSAVAMNVIAFLGERVRFLNKRIDTLSSGASDKKLASYLLSRAATQGCMTVDINCKKAAEIINVGRASLYRAIDSLVECGAIEFESKKITIKNIEQLERISK